ncbi:hypothetical protein [Paenibacillus shenyangensis]|uniref:hypothetical protein n=1 Tax=Paenibacillus sp. A9 TaxID=1284352 RepID=UPI0004760C4C|nr:hypothetical protein [Paenibacillus sp. A9]
MLIWKGWGILNIVIMGVMVFAVHGLLSLVGLDGIDSRLPMALAFIISGMIIWHLGKKFNAKSDRVFIDQETGEAFRMGNQHSLFFIPMHYWGPIGLVLGFVCILTALFD